MFRGHSKRVWLWKGSNLHVKSASPTLCPLPCANNVSRHARPFQSLPTLRQCTAKEFARQRVRTCRSKSPVKPLTHCAMHEKHFPTRQTCPTTLPTTPMHSKTLIPPKDSNPHAKNHTPAPNPLRHAQIPLPGTLHNPNHFPHYPHTQQNTPHPSGIEPAS